MSDTMEVWQLCQHNELEPHEAVEFDPGPPPFHGRVLCEGGKRIVLRKSTPAECSVYPDRSYLMTEVSDDE